jgi:hypothetical protein
MAFDTTGSEYGRAEDYDVQGDYLVKRPSYQGFTIFSLKKKAETQKKPKPEKRGKVREVPRRVTIHVIDGISSVNDLDARLQEVMPEWARSQPSHARRGQAAQVQTPDDPAFRPSV